MFELDRIVDALTKEYSGTKHKEVVDRIAYKVIEAYSQDLPTQAVAKQKYENKKYSKISSNQSTFTSKGNTQG